MLRNNSMSAFISSPAQISRKFPSRPRVELPIHPSSFTIQPSATPRSPQTPSLPDARPRSDRFRCAGRESKFLADRTIVGAFQIRMKTAVALLVSATLVAGITRAEADTTIDTTPAWDGGGVATLGGDGVVAYGQTFLAPTDSYLQSISVFVDEFGFNATTPVRFQMYLAPWTQGLNLARPVSPVLFTSDTLTTSGLLDGWQQVTVNFGGLHLTPGNRYIFFIGTYGLFDGVDHRLKVGFEQFNAPYPGGSFYYDGNVAQTTTLPQAFQHNWTLGPGNPSGGDMAFSATFAAVPEPAIGFLIPAGLLVLFLSQRSMFRSPTSH